MKILFLALSLALTASAATNRSPLVDVSGLPKSTAIIPSFDLLSLDAALNKPGVTGVKPANQFQAFAWISIPTGAGYPLLSSPSITCSNSLQHPFTQVGSTWFSSSNLCGSGDVLTALYCSNTNNPGTNLAPSLNVFYLCTVHSFQPHHWWTGVPCMQTYTAPYSWAISNGQVVATFDLSVVGLSCGNQQ